MSKVRVACFAISLDGYGAGPRQSLENPLGVGGTGLHQWFFPTRTFQSMLFGKDEGTTGLDDDYARRGIENLGAWILGRNMFAPMRGAWADEAWKGWWGDNPPYHVPVFVLTHHPRKSIEMAGGTTFHFVTEGADAALRLARQAAGTKDVRIGGGVQTVRQYVRALAGAARLGRAPALGAGPARARLPGRGARGVAGRDARRPAAGMMSNPRFPVRPEGAGPTIL